MKIKKKNKPDPGRVGAGRFGDFKLAQRLSFTSHQQICMEIFGKDGIDAYMTNRCISP